MVFVGVVRMGGVKDQRKVRDVVFAGIDFEGAGAQRGKEDWPVQIGMGTWSLKDGFDNLYVSYLEREGQVDWYAKKIHGIEESHLAGAPSLLSLWPEVNGRLGDGAVPVAHAKGTEKRFLRVFPGNPFDPWVDTLLLSRAAMPEQKKHSLGVLCEEIGVADKVRELIRKMTEKNAHDGLSRSSLTSSAQRQKVVYYLILQCMYHILQCMYHILQCMDTTLARTRPKL